MVGPEYSGPDFQNSFLHEGRNRDPTRYAHLNSHPQNTYPKVSLARPSQKGLWKGQPWTRRACLVCFTLQHSRGCGLGNACLLACLLAFRGLVEGCTPDDRRVDPRTWGRVMFKLPDGVSLPDLPGSHIASRFHPAECSRLHFTAQLRYQSRSICN